MPGAGSTRRGFRLGVHGGRGGFAAQLLQLGAQARLVLGDRLFEQASLVGVHHLGSPRIASDRLGLGAKLPALQACQLEGDLLGLGVTLGDVAVTALQQVAGLTKLAFTLDEGLVAQGQLLFGVLLPTGDPGRHFAGQCLQVQRGTIVRAQHGGMVSGPHTVRLAKNSEFLLG